VFNLFSITLSAAIWLLIIDDTYGEEDSNKTLKLIL